MKYASVLRRALVFGAVIAVAIAVVGSVIGYVVGGVPGAISALIAAVLAAVFMSLTTVSILVADRATKDNRSTGRYFGIIIGVWALKFVVFIVSLVLLSSQPWLNPAVFVFTLIAAVIGSLVVDAVAMLGARVPYVDVALPGEQRASTPSESTGI